MKNARQEPTSSASPSQNAFDSSACQTDSKMRSKKQSYAIPTAAFESVETCFRLRTYMINNSESRICAKKFTYRIRGAVRLNNNFRGRNMENWFITTFFLGGGQNLSNDNNHLSTAEWRASSLKKTRTFFREELLPSIHEPGTGPIKHCNKPFIREGQRNEKDWRHYITGGTQGCRHAFRMRFRQHRNLKRQERWLETWATGAESKEVSADGNRYTGMTWRYPGPSVMGASSDQFKENNLEEKSFLGRFGQFEIYPFPVHLARGSRFP